MLVGGTSLASPLIAAYYALLGGPSALTPPLRRGATPTPRR